MPRSLLNVYFFLQKSYSLKSSSENNSFNSQQIKREMKHSSYTWRWWSSSFSGKK
jgi:hypothetical protein